MTDKQHYEIRARCYAILHPKPQLTYKLECIDRNDLLNINKMMRPKYLGSITTYRHAQHVCVFW